MALGLKVIPKSGSGKAIPQQVKLSIGASCLVSWECFSLCCTPLATSQLTQDSHQVAACAIRDDGLGAEANCVQTPDEWDNSADLIEQMKLTDRLDRLKAINKSNNKKNVIFNQLAGKPPPPIAAQPGELDYPVQRPNFSSQSGKDSLNTIISQIWRPIPPAFNKLSILSQQEYLPIIKAQHAASLVRDGPTTAPPPVQLDEDQIDLDSSTTALLTELLHITDQQSLSTAGSDQPHLSTESPTTGN